MIFNKTTEYALRIMNFMAMDEKKLYSARDIYKNLRIPFRYLRKQLTILSKSGLIISVQGKNGGYRIAKNLSEISLLDITNVAGDNKINNECFFGFTSCAFEKKCAMHEKWAAVSNCINDVLISTTLEELKKTGTHKFISKNSLIFTKND